jgi:hypothetical protein
MFKGRPATRFAMAPLIVKKRAGPCGSAAAGRVLIVEENLGMEIRSAARNVAAGVTRCGFFAEAGLASPTAIAHALTHTHWCAFWKLNI